MKEIVWFPQHIPPSKRIRVVSYVQQSPQTAFSKHTARIGAFRLSRKTRFFIWTNYPQKKNDRARPIPLPKLQSSKPTHT